MKKICLYKQTLIGIALGLSVPVSVSGQGPRNTGNWSMPGNDPGQTGVQEPEMKLNSDNAGKNFKFLWKLQLGKPLSEATKFNEPLLRQRLINGRGFKDLVFWSDSTTLYAVDDELGRIEWQKHFDQSNPPAPCGAGSLQIVMEPPPTINFNAQRTPGAPPPPQPPPTPPSERKLGGKAGPGAFGLQGIYVLTNDGYLHEQVLSTGEDYAPPVKFLSGKGADPSGLDILGNSVVTVTSHNCGGVENGAWALQTTGEYPVSNYTAAGLDTLNLSGLPLTKDGTGYLVTGPGRTGSNLHPNSIVALDIKNGLTAKDWYTPTGGYATLQHVSPVVFTYKGRELLVAPGADGRVVLLDAASLGGANHHSALFESAPLSKGNTKHTWDSFAAWQDKQGATWVIASISAPVANLSSELANHGQAGHGAYVAFKVEGTSDKPTMTPVWISRDMVNPAPPVITNDIVIALAAGAPGSHAVLYVLDATNGKELYSSKDEISTFAHFSGVSFGNSHAYFTDHNNVLYAFGIEMEH